MATFMGAIGSDRHDFIVLSKAIQDGKDRATGKPVITIVEDDTLVLRSLARLIRAAGYRVLAFESAEEFLESTQAGEVACAILDLQLPGMSGLELQARLAAANCRVPIVFVTAHDEPETRAQALQNGAIAFFGKPLKDDDLLEVIDSAVGNS